MTKTIPTQIGWANFGGEAISPILQHVVAVGTADADEEVGNYLLYKAERVIPRLWSIVRFLDVYSSEISDHGSYSLQFEKNSPPEENVLLFAPGARVNLMISPNGEVEHINYQWATLGAALPQEQLEEALEHEGSGVPEETRERRGLPADHFYG